MLADDDRRRLREAAELAATRAYCPYSRFPVGAAVLAASGAVFGGCNVENASYGLTICAERAAASQLVAAGEPPSSLRAVWIYTPTPTPTPPRGACRQVLAELGPDCLVIATCDGPETIETTLDRLLPGAFGADRAELTSARAPSRRSLFRFVEIDRAVVELVAATMKGEVSIITGMTRTGDALMLNGMHVDGPGTGALGIRGLRRLAVDLGERLNARQVTIHGGIRTTGANPGRSPRPIAFSVGDRA